MVDGIGRRLFVVLWNMGGWITAYMCCSIGTDSARECIVGILVNHVALRLSSSVSSNQLIQEPICRTNVSITRCP